MIACSKLLCGSAMLATLSPPKDGQAAPLDAMRRKISGNGAQEALRTSITAPPSVAWNVSYRCNLSCLHCPMDANARDVRDELTTGEARAMIEDLAAMQVPVLLLSGGEPLMREDILDLACFAAGKGLHPALSTNGTLIDRRAAGRIRDAGIEYAGISFDGLEATHNLFRRSPRAFQDAVKGVCNCNEAGVKTGIRFTLNAWNYPDLPSVLDLAEKLKVLRFCMCPRVYSDRGSAMGIRESEDSAPVDSTPEQRCAADSLLIEKAIDWDHRGVRMEILTTDPHAEGAYIRAYITGAARSKESEEVAAISGAARSQKSEESAAVSGAARRDESQEGAAISGAARRQESEEGAAVSGAARSHKSPEGAATSGAVRSQKSEEVAAISGAGRNRRAGESEAAAGDPRDGAGDVRRLLEMDGGCSAGCKMSNVDPQGNVRACRFWGHVALGNVRERKFSEIWREPNALARQFHPLNT